MLELFFAALKNGAVFLPNAETATAIANASPSDSSTYLHDLVEPFADLHEQGAVYTHATEFR